MEPSSQFTLGIDLSQDSFDAAISLGVPELDRWRELPQIHIATPPESPQAITTLLAWIDAQQPDARCTGIVVESTGKISKRFAKALRGHGLPEVAIANPRRTKAFTVSLGVRDKTDDIDARLLALYAAVRRPKPATPRSDDEEQIREMSRLREDYLKDLTAWKSRRREASDDYSRHSIDATIKHIKQAIADLDKALKEEIKKNKVLSGQVELIKKIKGIKQVVATTLTAELGDLSRYSRTKLTAAAGLFPKRFNSGTSVHKKPRLAKGGGASVRRVLYMGATSLFRSKGPLRDYIEHLRSEGLKDMSITGAMMRKLLLIARAVAKSGTYEEGKICRQCG